jgi:hypothetical protein
MNDAFPPSKPWIKGMNLTEQILHPNTQQLINIILPIFLDKLTNDEDEEIVIDTAECISEIAKKIGPNSIYSFLSGIIASCCILLKKEGACQTSNEDVDLNDEDTDLEMQCL